MHVFLCTGAFGATISAGGTEYLSFAAVGEVLAPATSVDGAARTPGREATPVPADAAPPSTATLDKLPSTDAVAVVAATAAAVAVVVDIVDSCGGGGGSDGGKPGMAGIPLAAVENSADAEGCTSWPGNMPIGRCCCIEKL